MNDFRRSPRSPNSVLRKSHDHGIASESLNRRRLNLQTSLYILNLFKSLQPAMSVSSTSTAMLRRALRSARLATFVSETSRTIWPAATNASRTVSSAARLPTITASETRRRPTVRPYQQPVAPSAVNGLSPTSKRTIFIQTENTPNPDVRFLFIFFVGKSDDLGTEIYSQPPSPPGRFPNHVP